MPGKTNLFLINGPATITSSFLKLPNDNPVHFEQLPVPNEDSYFKQTFVPMTTASTGLQADNDCHSILNDVTAPMTAASTGLQADNDCHSILNDVVSPQAFSALSATLTATMTQVPAITTAITKGTIKLDECFLHPAKTGANNATNKRVKVFCFMLISAQQLQLQEFTHKVSCCFRSMAIQQL
jgi:hypothetical protein